MKKAKKIFRKHEAVQEQQQILQNGTMQFEGGNAREFCWANKPTQRQRCLKQASTRRGQTAAAAESSSSRTGTSRVILPYKGQSCAQPVYVISRLQLNLLGLPAIQALHLLTQVDILEKTSVPKQFPGLFTGPGTIQESFEMKLKPETQNFALFTPHNVPIPLCKKFSD